MTRASGNDLAELFGYAPDDRSAAARSQWRSQACPFVGNKCIKHSHGATSKEIVIYGTCSVANKRSAGVEEVIICPQRLYADNYAVLRRCAADALGTAVPVMTVTEYQEKRLRRQLPPRIGVLLGQNSGREIAVSRSGVIDLSLDWVIAVLDSGRLVLAIPCEVQSIDITGNYRSAWQAYALGRPDVPNSEHGMNWANVWKRLIPQLIMKSTISSTSAYCSRGTYFVLPERVFQQFEKLVGTVPAAPGPDVGCLTVFTYNLGPIGSPGTIRPLELSRVLRFSGVDFARAFASGSTLPLGIDLDEKIERAIAALRE
jgi:hypothetical protein